MKKIFKLCFIVAIIPMVASAKYDTNHPCYDKMMLCVRTCESAAYDDDGFYKSLNSNEIENINICLDKCDKAYDACKKLSDPEDVVEDEQTQDKKTVSLKNISGEIEIKRAGQEEWINATKDIELQDGDLIATGFSSSVLLHFPDGSTAQLNEITQLKVESLFTEDGKPRTDLRLRTGGLKANISKVPQVESDFKVTTPVSTIGVRGTTFHVRHDEENKITDVYVVEGEVSVTDVNEQGEVIVKADQHTSVVEGELPQKPILSSEVEEPWWGDQVEQGHINLVLMLAGFGIILFMWKKIKGKKVKL